MRKEAIHILRDPRSLYLAIGMPILLIILFGYAITFNIKHIPVGIIDQDNTTLSRELISGIKSNEYFEVVYFSNNYFGVEKLLDEGKTKIIVAVPPHFFRDLSKGKDTAIQLLVDGSDNNTAQIALGYISKIIQTFSSNIILVKLKTQGALFVQDMPLFDVETRAWYNPALNSTHFIVPGLIVVVMMILTSMMTSMTIAREWEIGTMEQLIATPVKPYEIIIGKLMPYFFLGIIQMALLVLIGILLFKVPLKGNLFLLSIASGIFLVCGLGIGLLISTVTKSQQLAFMLSVLSSLLPSFLLSGFVFPVSSMPKIIQIISNIVPAKYFLIILRGIFLKGNGFSNHLPDLIPLIILGTLIILTCSIRLRLSLE